MSTWDSLRARLAQQLGELEGQNLSSADEELQQRQAERGRPSGLGLAFHSPAADAYFRRQGNEADAAFLRSYLQNGTRPAVRVGYAADEGHDPNTDLFSVQQLLQQQRLKQQGFA